MIYLPTTRRPQEYHFKRRRSPGSPFLLALPQTVPSPKQPAGSLSAYRPAGMPPSLPGKRSPVRPSPSLVLPNITQVSPDAETPLSTLHRQNRADETDLQTILRLSVFCQPVLTFTAFLKNFPARTGQDRAVRPAYTRLANNVKIRLKDIHQPHRLRNIIY
jgi:hypothetical protein